MKQLLRQTVSVLGWRLPLRRLLTSTAPVVLVYHGTARNGRRFSASNFETQLEFLQAHFDLISIDQLNSHRRRLGRIQVLLTFDDGLRNNAEIAAPMLASRGIPAIFFVCTRPANQGGVLWFSYLEMLGRYFQGNALTYRGENFDMTQNGRESSLRKLRTALLALRPHPAAMYDAIDNELPRIDSFTTPEQRRDECDGMSAEQIAQLAHNPLFMIGAHTLDHPLLTLCTPPEAARQISANKSWIESVTGRPCGSIAYPISDYNADILRASASAGFQFGFSAERKIAGDPQMQVPRVGIYYPSLTELGFKVRWGNALQTLQRRGLAPAGSRL